MSEYFLEDQELKSEGDVETKVILPLITNKQPLGLGVSRNNVQSKNNLKKLLLDKGDKAIRYYPDFVINIEGVPLVVIEAKKMGKDLKEAFREASLYAGEINRLFGTKVNPCKLIFASDGRELVAGYWDEADPKFQINVSEWIPTAKDFSNFIDLFSAKNLSSIAKEYKNTVRENIQFKNPLHLVGGKHIQNQSTSNSFGESISIQYRHLFNPNDEHEKADIVKNAYVTVEQHQSHIEPIDRLIRKKIRPAVEESKELKDHEEPKEILEKLKSPEKYNNKVLLLIGSVGSGKSTFTTYLKEVALDKSLINNIKWINIDFNDAPVTSSEIYKWVKKKIINKIKEMDQNRDHDDLRFIKHLYSEQINSLKKGILSIFDKDSERAKEILANKILEFQNDLDLTLECYIQKIIKDNGKELVIVLDNCDKRNLEEQLLMFEVANWLKDDVNAIIFLPLRDTTFDHFRNQKPLDTVINDLIFRINPPSLKQVIYNRIRYADRLSDNQTDNTYTLPNGFKVKYPADDELHYLKSILYSLFENRFFKSLITGLAGRNIRRGIEIFLDFCKSGFISENEILKMKQTKGDHKLPDHLISRVFIRGNRLYYSDADSRIKNLFHSDPSKEIPNPFTRVSILQWLSDRERKKGPSGILGFHSISTMINDLTMLGHSESRIQDEVLFLLKHRLIISESQKTSSFEENELISINPPGITHLKLLKNIDYLASCAENVWYKKEVLAEKISDNMVGKGAFEHLSIQTNTLHSDILINYLKDYYESYFSFYSEIIDEDDFKKPIDFDDIKSKIESLKSDLFDTSYEPLETGSVQKATIQNIKGYGLICNLKNSTKIGIIFANNLNDKFRYKYEAGDNIKVKIVNFSIAHDKYDLKIVD